MNLPYGAQEIVQLRSQGKRPADLILVSMMGLLKDEINPVVIAKDQSYDWRFLHGLNVMIVVNMKTSPEAIHQISEDIAAVKPEYCGVVWYDKNDGLNICWGSYKPKAKWMRCWNEMERSQWCRQ